MKMSAQSMGRYTREEFVGGMRKMGADSLQKLKVGPGDRFLANDSCHVIHHVSDPNLLN